MRSAVERHPDVPLRRELLPRGDAVHPLRHRGHLPLPGRGAAQVVRYIRAGRDDHLRRASVRRVRVRLETRCARMDMTLLKIEQRNAKDLLRTDATDEDIEPFVQDRELL